MLELLPGIDAEDRARVATFAESLSLAHETVDSPDGAVLRISPAAATAPAEAATQAHPSISLIEIPSYPYTILFCVFVRAACMYVCARGLVYVRARVHLSHVHMHRYVHESDTHGHTLTNT